MAADVPADERERLVERIITAEQDERRRLALFLHDGPVQSLAGIALMLDAAVRLSPVPLSATTVSISPSRVSWIRTEIFDGGPRRTAWFSDSRTIW